MVIALLLLLPALISHPNSRGSLSLPYQDWNTRKEYILAEPLVGGRVLSLVIDERPWRAIICFRRKYLAISRVLNCFTLYIIIINFSPASAMLTLSLLIVEDGKMRVKLYTAFCEHEGFFLPFRKGALVVSQPIIACSGSRTSQRSGPRSVFTCCMLMSIAGLPGCG